MSEAFAPSRAASAIRCPPVARAMAGINASLLGALGLVLSIYLWPQWRHNPDLSHGLFMPAVFLLLVWQSRRIGPLRHPRPGAWSLFVFGLLGLVALVCLAGAGLFAVSLGWSHSLVAFSLTAAFTAGLLAALVALSAEPLRLASLNWVAFAAAILWLLAAPMPPGTYTTLTLELQAWVTAHVLAALQLLGVAARQQGNLIELANATVGVEEACSGIRSLLACVFAGLFFAALLVRRPWARAILLVVAAPLAIAMNFARSLTLTLLADAGVNIGGFWHDATGYAVLAVTAGVLVGLSYFLESRWRVLMPASAPPPAGPVSARAVLASQALLGALLLLASAMTGFFVLRTRADGHAVRPVPDLAALLPVASAGWTVVTSTDLYRFADTLETDHLIQRTYFRGTNDDVTQVTVYLAYWLPGQTSVSNVALHTPDACWPGVGWQPVPAVASRLAPIVADHALPAAEYRLFTSGEVQQHVWFWHLYDGAAITQRDPRSARELLALAWRYGFRKNGDQLFVRVSSNRPWNAIVGESLMARIFSNLRALGF
jgi:exosortase